MEQLGGERALDVSTLAWPKSPDGELRQVKTKVQSTCDVGSPLRVLAMGHSLCGIRVRTQVGGGQVWLSNWGFDWLQDSGKRPLTVANNTRPQLPLVLNDADSRTVGGAGGVLCDVRCHIAAREARGTAEGHSPH